ncbi:conserved hypothetical protein [Roseibium sp. TrichSKD4]|nr:conserved hypothetical protein [Roseibium sp. TrichSKD4]
MIKQQLQVHIFYDAPNNRKLWIKNGDSAGIASFDNKVGKLEILG